MSAPRFSSRRLSVCRLASCLVALIPTGVMAREQAVIDESWKALFQAHCRDCHSSDAPTAGLDLSRLDRQLDHEPTFAVWERIYDRIRLGEMPPADAPPIHADTAGRFLADLKIQLVRAHADRRETVFRRLNRSEYQNTLNDLFGTTLQLAEMLPEDGRAGEFDNVGSALNISMVQLQKYLEAARFVLDEAIEDAVSPPESQRIEADYASTRGAEKFLGKQWLLLDDGSVVFYRRHAYPTGMLREANARVSGIYEAEITGYAWQSEAPVTFSVASTTFQRGVSRPTFGYFAFRPGEPQTVRLRVRLLARDMLRIEPCGITDVDNALRKHGIATYQGPGLAISKVVLTGPITEQYPSAGHRLLFDGLTRREVDPSRRSRLRPDQDRPWRIDSNDPVNDAAAVIDRIAGAAFRRPATPETTAPWLQLFRERVRDGDPFEEALRTVTEGMLCSPDFLYLHEPGRPVDNYALASRISYFLSRTTPDARLRSLAENGQLASSSAVLRKETERLLGDPRFQRFVTDFTDAWLNLREIEFTTPDNQLFPEYDEYLLHSMLDETRGFIDQLFLYNRPIDHLIRPDFAYLNGRIAEHYGISGVEGPDFRRVPIDPGNVRGGLLGQSAVHKVTANGTNTSPVVRGAWVMERILGTPSPPPPPGISGVEPDIRGATTLRELLERHRDSDSCRSCHRHIDPPGFAMECFNPIGGLRQRFRSLGEGDRVAKIVHGRTVRYKLGPPVDASGITASGETFSGFAEYRDILAADRETLYRTVISKLTTFALGRELGFSDRDPVNAMVRESLSENYGLRDLIHLVVQSELFRQP